MWDASDEALMAGFATGDPGAALAFVRRFQSRVHGLAMSIVRDPGEAEQVAQDAFVRAWRYAASFDARRGSVVGWLLGITRNVAFDRARLARRHRERVVQETADGAPFVHLVADGDGVDELAERSDAVTRVAGALGHLPEQQRQALLAVTVGGRTAQEHAADVGIPLGTAKTRVRLGLRKLRDVLEVHAG